MELVEVVKKFMELEGEVILFYEKILLEIVLMEKGWIELKMIEII